MLPVPRRSPPHDWWTKPGPRSTAQPDAGQPPPVHPAAAPPLLAHAEHVSSVGSPSLPGRVPGRAWAALHTPADVAWERHLVRYRLWRPDPLTVPLLRTILTRFGRHPAEWTRDGRRPSTPPPAVPTPRPPADGRVQPADREGSALPTYQPQGRSLPPHTGRQEPRPSRRDRVAAPFRDEVAAGRFILAQGWPPCAIPWPARFVPHRLWPQPLRL